MYIYIYIYISKALALRAHGSDSRFKAQSSKDLRGSVVRQRIRISLISFEGPLVHQRAGAKMGCVGREGHLVPQITNFLAMLDLGDMGPSNSQISLLLFFSLSLSPLLFLFLSLSLALRGDTFP